MHDLVIIHSKDTVSWKDYILGYLGKEVFNKKIIDKRDTDLMETINDLTIQSDISKAKAVVIIVSPLHLQFLHEFPSFNYSRFVVDIKKAQLFLCGVEISDFDAPDGTGAPIYHRFPRFIDWIKLSHDQHDNLLRNAMVLMETEDTGASTRAGKNGSSGTKRRHKKDFQVTPTQVRCKESTVITILFKVPVAEHDEEVPVIIVFRVANNPVRIEATWRNPYVYQFTAPDLPSGPHGITVTVRGNELGTKHLTYVPIDQPNSIHPEFAQIFVNQLEQLCRYICKTGLMTAEVDSILSESLDDSNTSAIPAQVYEQIFGVYAPYKRAAENSAFEFPTLLHLAANFGFQEFASKLIDLPDAQVACTIKNASGRIPENLASDNSYDDLALLFQDFRVINETIYSAYEVFLPESGGHLSDSSDTSRTPTATHSSSGSDDTYMTMRGSVKKKQDDSDSENGYVDVDSELQELQARRADQADAQKTSTSQSSGPQQSDPNEPHSFSGAASGAEDTTQPETDESNLEGVPDCQKELIDIITQAKQGKITISEAEHLIKGWKFRHGTGRSRSFKERQHQLSRLRVQLSKTKEPVKEPSCWNSVIGRSLTSPETIQTQITVLADLDKLFPISSPSSVEAAAAAVRQHLLATDFACKETAAECESHKTQQCQILSKPELQQSSFSSLESQPDNSQRHSNISGSSRESLLSVTSRASTSSGVDIDVADDETQSDLDCRSISCRRGNDNLGGGMRHLSNKRKSKNLSRLEEELSCSESRLPPPLPPRATPSKHSTSEVPYSMPSSYHRVTPGSILLPPLPSKSETTRKRSGSEGSILDPPSRGPIQSPPSSSPKIGGREKGKGLESRARKPLPPEPVGPGVSEHCPQVYSRISRKLETGSNSSSMKTVGSQSSLSNPPRSLPLTMLQEAKTLSDDFSGTGHIPSTNPEQQHKLKSSESFGGRESQKIREKAEFPVRRNQTTPRLSSDSNEARKLRNTHQSKPAEVSTTKDGSYYAVLTPDSPRIPHRLLQNRNPSISPSHEFCQQYAIHKSTSNQNFQESEVFSDRRHEANDCSSSRSFTTEPGQKYNAPMDSINPISRVCSSEKIIETYGADGKQCSEQKVWSNEMIVMANTQQQCVSEINQRLPERKPGSGIELNPRSLVQQKSMTDERRGSFPKTPTTVDLEKPFSVLQSGNSMSEVTLIIKTRNASHDSTAQSRSPISDVSTFARGSPVEQTVTRSQELRSDLGATSSSQPTTIKVTSEITQEINTLFSCIDDRPEARPPTRVKLPPPQKFTRSAKDKKK